MIGISAEQHVYDPVLGGGGCPISRNKCCVMLEWPL